VASRPHKEERIKLSKFCCLKRFLCDLCCKAYSFWGYLSWLNIVPFELNYRYFFHFRGCLVECKARKARSSGPTYANSIQFHPMWQVGPTKKKELNFQNFIWLLSWGKREGNGCGPHTLKKSKSLSLSLSLSTSLFLCL